MKFLEKHGLFKLVSIVLVIAIVLTWLVPNASFNAGQLVADDFNRVGLFDITTYGLLGFNYFPLVFLFLFIVAGFYGFISKIDAYQEMTDRIAKKFSNKTVFTIVSMVVYAALASIVTDYAVLFILVPLTLNIASKVKLTKVNAFISSFGGILLGVLCSTLNGNVAKIISSNFSLTSFTQEYIAIAIVFVIGAVLLSYLAIEEQKVTGKKEEKLAVDLFAPVEAKEVVAETKKGAKKSVKTKVKKVNIVPMAITFGLFMLITLIAFVNWDAIGVTAFNDLHTKLMEATLFGTTIFKFILGTTAAAFGAWTQFHVFGLSVVIVAILAIIYKVNFMEIVERYFDGMKKVAKTVLIVFIIYIVLETFYFFPTTPNIANSIYEIFGDNVFTWMTTTAITSIFGVEYQYTMQSLAGLLTAIGTETPAVVALASQFAYGIMSFVMPTSAMLAIGLQTMGISVKEYFKFIWKFLVAMIVVTAVVLVILVLI
jgi:uncharacterized ion transporter superfamily protein YfcC